jgi:hypothetical protein
MSQLRVPWVTTYTVLSRRCSLTHYPKKYVEPQATEQMLFHLNFTAPSTIPMVRHKLLYSLGQSIVLDLNQPWKEKDIGEQKPMPAFILTWLWEGGCVLRACIILIWKKVRTGFNFFLNKLSTVASTFFFPYTPIINVPYIIQPPVRNFSFFKIHYLL